MKNKSHLQQWQVSSGWSTKLSNNSSFFMIIKCTVLKRPSWRKKGAYITTNVYSLSLHFCEAKMNIFIHCLELRHEANKEIEIPHSFWCLVGSEKKWQTVNWLLKNICWTNYPIPLDSNWISIQLFSYIVWVPTFCWYFMQLVSSF